MMTGIDLADELLRVTSEMRALVTELNVQLREKDERIEELRAALRDADRVIAHDANPLSSMDEGYAVRPLREAALERHKAHAALGER